MATSELTSDSPAACWNLAAAAAAVVAAVTEAFDGVWVAEADGREATASGRRVLRPARFFDSEPRSHTSWQPRKSPPHTLPQLAQVHDDSPATMTALHPGQIWMPNS